MRLLGTGIALLMGLGSAAQQCCAADAWGGSVGITSNYLVRGISRSNDRAALQTDLHYLNTSGFVAGLFVSSSHNDPDEPRDVEISGFLGFDWNPGNDWRGKILATHYSYPWNKSGSQYDYNEIDLEIGYREWLDIVLEFSPNAPYFSPDGYPRSGFAESAEMNLHRTVVGKLSGTAGIGYYYLDGRAATGYAYWSAGVAYDLAPVSLSVAWVETSAAAKPLFYNAAAGGRWTGTVIWRF